MKLVVQNRLVASARWAVALWAIAPSTAALAQSNRLPGMQNTSRVAAGRAHVVTIGTGSVINTWGSNASGELGDGTTTQRTSPVNLPNNSTIVAVAAGDSFSMAIDQQGLLYAWGKNSSGQLGNSTTTSQSTPGVTASGGTFRSVAVGNAHTVAIRADGTMWGWGANAQGQLGQGTTTSFPYPVEIGLSNDRWLASAAGNQFSLGLKADGTLWSWGFNASGQLGVGNTTARMVPVQVGSNHWLKTAAGTSHVLAIRDDGTLWSWGLNDKGQLGDNSTTNRTSPVQVTSTPGPWIEISAGDKFSAAVKADGSLWEWGDNSVGQLGQGNTANHSTPTQVGTVRGWQSVNAGAAFTVAVKADGTLYTWGNGSNGQLATGATANTSAPANIRLSGAKRGMITAGGSTSANIRATGVVEIWGHDDVGQLGIGVVDPNNAYVDFQILNTTRTWKQIALGDTQGLAVRGDGTLWGWGGNASGEVGDGTTTLRSRPVQIGTDTKWIAVAARGSHSFGLKADGTLWGWGENPWQQLGDGTATDRHAPVQISSGHKWVAVSTSLYHTLAISSDGKLWAWGYNGFGEVGDGTTTNRASPVQVGAGTTWAAIAGNIYTTSAISVDGRLWGWGYDADGEVGDNGTTNSIPSPVAVDADYVDLCAGQFNALGRKAYAVTDPVSGSSSIVLGWGLNASGELGTADTNSRLAPSVTLLGGIIFACGSQYSLAMFAGGYRSASGVNTWGQLGAPTSDPNGVSTPTSLEDNMELYPVDRFSQSGTWIPTAFAGPNNPPPASNALDMVSSTRWTTNTAQASNQWFQVDMQDPRTFAQLTLDAGGSTNDYPRAYQVFVSNNGTTWGSAVATGSGDFKYIRISFPPQTARYVKVVLTGAASNWWSIAELDLQL